MAGDDLLAQVLRQLDWAVAVVGEADGQVLFENARFFQWFPLAADPDAEVWSRLSGIDRALLAERLARRGKHQIEMEVKLGARTIPVVLTVRRFAVDGQDCLLLEAADVGKQREAEYLLDSYSKMAERRQRELEKERDRAEKLLLNIMPRTVYEELREFGTTTPARFDNASVLLLDFVGFTEMAIAGEPSAVVAELNDIFTAFDRIVELFGGERIKTIGDAYMAVAGLPEANPEHAANLAKVAIRFRRYLRRRNQSHPVAWRCRIGIATGPVIGSIVGIQKYVYDVFGPAVNLAARLEALAEPDQIVISDTTRQQLGNTFDIAERPPQEVKGFGEQRIFSLEGEPATR